MPFAIQAEIMKWLPTKSLMQFRSVSKAWKSLIDSCKFIADHSTQQTHQHHLLVCYIEEELIKMKYVSIVDDDDHSLPFPGLTSNTPVPGGLFKPAVIGISQGLFCLYNTFRSKYGRNIILWNPSIRKSVSVSLDAPYNVLDPKTPGYQTIFGFSVCPCTSDPKLVKITYVRFEDINIIRCTPWQVEVYTLSSRAWTSITTINQPRNSAVLRSKQVVIDENIYWLATDGVHIDKFITSGTSNMIVSFDITSHRFMEISLPADTNLARAPYFDVTISKLKESLVVVDQSKEVVYDVWMMTRKEDGVPNSFTKLFTINIPDTSIEAIHAFRKNDEPVFATTTHTRLDRVHEVYVEELHSEQLSYIGISGPRITYFVYSYMETLLLLDH